MNKSVVITFLSAAGISLSVNAANALNLNESNLLQNNESNSILSESVEYEVIPSINREDGVFKPSGNNNTCNGMCW